MENQLPKFAILICGGKGIRTPDLLIANETLYQLSYTPVYLLKMQFETAIEIRFAHRFITL